VKILTYHVISGEFDAAAVIAAIKKGKGKVELTTVSSGKLTASLENGKVKLSYQNQRKALRKRGAFFLEMTQTKSCEKRTIIAGSGLLKKTMFADSNAGRACRVGQSRPEP